MKEGYENWKELKPLTAPVPLGTKCVVLSDVYGLFESGEIVTICEIHDICPDCYSKNGIKNPMRLEELALLPSEEPAKVERKIVQIATDANSVYALCDDGTAWELAKAWKQLPPIPQDAV